MRCERRNHFVWLSDLAAELEAITGMRGRRLRDAMYPLLLLPEESMAPEENPNLHFFNGMMTSIRSPGKCKVFC
jgi:hypothetical protein